MTQDQTLKAMKTHSKSPPTSARRWAAVITVGFAALLFFVSSASGAVDIYMKFDGIPGSIPAGPFAGYSQLVDATGGTVAPVAAGIPPVASLSLFASKRIDKTSPLLMKACGDGTVTPRVTIVWTKGGESFYRVTLVDVVVSSFQTVAEPAELPLETISLNFQKIEWTSMTTLGENGGLTTNFDQANQQAITKIRPHFRAEIGSQAGRPGLHVTWPVEAGHSYRVKATNNLSGEWFTLQEYTAPEDGVADQMIQQGLGRMFIQIEALD